MIFARVADMWKLCVFVYFFGIGTSTIFASSPPHSRASSRKPAAECLSSSLTLLDPKNWTTGELSWEHRKELFLGYFESLNKQGFDAATIRKEVADVIERLPETQRLGAYRLVKATQEIDSAFASSSDWHPVIVALSRSKALEFWISDPFIPIERREQFINEMLLVDKATADRLLGLMTKQDQDRVIMAWRRDPVLATPAFGAASEKLGTKIREIDFSELSPAPHNNPRYKPFYGKDRWTISSNKQLFTVNFQSGVAVWSRSLNTTRGDVVPVHHIDLGGRLNYEPLFLKETNQVAIVVQNNNLARVKVLDLSAMKLLSDTPIDYHAPLSMPMDMGSGRIGVYTLSQGKPHLLILSVEGETIMAQIPLKAGDDVTGLRTGEVIVASPASPAEGPVIRWYRPNLLAQTLEPIPGKELRLGLPQDAANGRPVPISLNRPLEDGLTAAFLLDHVFYLVREGRIVGYQELPAGAKNFGFLEDGRLIFERRDELFVLDYERPALGNVDLREVLPTEYAASALILDVLANPGPTQLRATPINPSTGDIVDGDMPPPPTTP